MKNIFEQHLILFVLPFLPEVVDPVLDVLEKFFRERRIKAKGIDSNYIVFVLCLVLELLDDWRISFYFFKAALLLLELLL